jgi:hypothetical protein
MQFKFQTARGEHHWFLSIVTAFCLTHVQANYALEIEEASDGKIVSAGPHSRTIERVWRLTSDAGVSHLRTNRYVEVSGGLNRWTGTDWIPSKALFEQAASGFIFARSSQHQLILGTNAQSDVVVDLLTPSGSRVRSRPIGLALLNTETGQEEIIAEVKNALPEIVSQNEVYYRDAFNGIHADLRIKIEIGSFEADVIIREDFQLPEGYSSESTDLEVITQFFDDPSDITLGGGNATNDQTVVFGEFIIGPGNAFSAQAERAEDIHDTHKKVKVKKKWRQLGEGKFLFESVRWNDISSLLNELPRFERPEAGVRQKANEFFSAIKPVDPTTERDAGPRFVKSAAGSLRLTIDEESVSRSRHVAINLRNDGEPQRPGVVIDYVGVVSAGNFLFQGDTTYLVSGPVTFSTLTVEGGAVIKYEANTTAKITTSGYVNSARAPCSMYRPVVFTGKFDNTVGQMIAVSATPPATYGACFLEITTTYGTTLEHLKVNSAKVGIRYIGQASSYGEHTLRHVQFVNSETALRLEGYGSSYYPLTLRCGNLLFANIGTAFYAQSYAYYTVENVTASNVSLLGGGSSSYGNGSASFRNSIFSGIAANAVPGMSVSGIYNAFYNCAQTFGTMPPGFSQQLSASPFETIAAGQYYLSPTSGLQNKGTTSIASALATDLKLRTTVKPILSSNYWLTGTMTETWTQSATRDVDTPDLGWHYAPLDRLIFGACASGPDTKITIAPGVAVGVYGYAGFFLRDGATLCIEGTPDAPAQICYFNQVQEQPIVFGNQGNKQFYFIGGNNGRLQMKFARSDFLSGTALLHLATFDTFWNFSDCYVRDSFFGSGAFYTFGVPNNRFLIQNTLFNRVWSWWGPKGDFLLFNNLFYGGTIDHHMDPSLAAKRVVSGNIFDKCELWPDGEFPITHSYNAFVYQAGTTPVTFLPFDTATEKTVTGLPYAIGKYGRFYQSSSSPLIDPANNVSPGSRGLTAYTVLPGNGAAADSGTLDIGIHYPAITSAGVLLDTNSDLTPDYSVNAPPSLTLGSDISVSSKRFRLSADIFDDGRGCSEFLLLTWSKVSGPGSAAIESQGMAETYIQVGKSGTYTFKLNATDLVNVPVEDQITVQVTVANLAPSITTTATAMAYRVGAKNEPVDDALLVTDPDSLTLKEATVQITQGYVSSQDLLSANPGSPRFTATFNASTATLTITAVGGSASIYEFQELLRRVQYMNSSGMPATAPRAVTFRVFDEEGGMGMATRQISVTPINRFVKVDAGDPQSAPTAPTVTVVLNGTVSPSADPDGDTLTFKWELVGAPPGATVVFSPSAANTKNPSVTLSQNGDYAFRFTVSDGVNTEWDETTINVCDGRSPDFDVALVVDVSSSLANRLEWMKDSATQLATVLFARPGIHKIGLITVGDSSCVSQVLTTDKDTLIGAIQQLTSHDSTQLESGIRAAAQELWSQRGRPATAKPRKLMIVMSDGNSTLNNAATEAKDSGVKIVSLGIPDSLGIIDGGALTAIASPNSVYFPSSAAQCIEMLNLIMTDPCSLTLPPASKPLNGSAYAATSGVKLECDSFFVNEDSITNILDVFANDINIGSLSPLPEFTFELFNPALQISSTSNKRAYIENLGHFEIFWHQDPYWNKTLPKLLFTPAPNCYLRENSLWGAYSYGAASADFRIAIKGIDDAPIATEDGFSVLAGTSTEPCSTVLPVARNDINLDMSRFRP